MSDPLLDDHQLQSPESDFQRLAQQLLAAFGGTWLLKAIASQIPSILLINIGVTGMTILLMVVCLRILPYFREAPYLRVMRYAQMVYTGMALAFVMILANINAWYELSRWSQWLQYGLFYGGIALLLVEYYSDFSVAKKASHWRQLYTLVVAWILMAVVLRGWNILTLYFIGDTSANDFLEWLLLGTYALVAVLSWFRYGAEDPSDMRWWAIGYSLVMVLLFVAMESRTLPTAITEAALFGAVLVGVPLGALLMGRK